MTVRVELLGRFRVLVAGKEVAPDGWPARRAAELVQLLALANGHTLLRDQVIEALWSHLDPEAGAANLRKAAHHARQALGDQQAVVLRSGEVALFPFQQVETDVECFERAAQTALRTNEPIACTEAAAAYVGDLLPGALYEDWANARRDQLKSRYVTLLRLSGAWERLVEVEPTDEQAYRELMCAALRAGNRHAAIRWYGRLRTTLQQELGMPPGPESEALYDECVAGLLSAEQELVGRQIDLARAEAALQAAARAELGALVVRGPAGIGKSALSRRVASIARGQGWTVATATAISESDPYAPLVDVVEQLLSHDHVPVEKLSDRTRSVLAELTMLAAPAPPIEGALTRHQVIGALRRVLLADDAARMMLVIDDAHLADDATIDALLHLISVSSTGRLFVVLAYRPELAGEALARGVARLDRAGMTVTVNLEPLDREDAGALVAAAASAKPDAAAVAKVVDLAAGNPFFLLELARGLDAGVAPAGVPTVWEAVAARFVDLDQGLRAMLQRLAVTGADLDPAGILAVSGRPEPETSTLLDAALSADLLVVSGTHYRFRHELVRQALVEQIPPHRRTALHRDIADRLSSAGGQAAVIAGHWLAGGRPDEAIGWQLAAARHAVKLGALRDGLGYLEVLLEHAPTHAAALCLKAETLEALGDERAPGAYAAAAEVASAEDRHEIKAKQALASVRAGDPAGAIEALEGIEPRSIDGRLAQALAMCGAAAMGMADPARGELKAVEIRRLAVASGQPAAIVIASWAEAAAAHARGDLPRLLTTGLRDTHALPELAVTIFDGQLCVAERLLYGGRPYPEVIAFADALEAEAKRLGASRGRAFATTFRGEAELLTGRLEEADHDLATGVRLHQAIGAVAGEALSLQRWSEVAFYRGRRADAAALLDEALAVARESDLGFHLLDRIYGARITAAAADPDLAMAAVEEAEAGVHGSGETCPGCQITLAVPAAIAAAKAGDLERAWRYEQAAEKLTVLLMRLPGWYAALDEVRGHRAVATGDRIEAEARFTAATIGFRKAGQPLDADRCLTWAARNV
ncbi:ATP-binding protein [Kribbella sancticallisti]|uniref:ATP-binding protein n=1 Tax=Kribbella sancticallisti TaxID=460087 RepID=UPI0031E03021